MVPPDMDALTTFSPHLREIDFGYTLIYEPWHVLAFSQRLTCPDAAGLSILGDHTGNDLELDPDESPWTAVHQDMFTR
jgi:hypothetical protein